MNAKTSDMPDSVAAIARRGYAIWADNAGSDELRQRFKEPMEVAGIRHVRQWGIQVDDERELPGLERTQIADDELWEINLVATDGSTYEINAALLKPAD